MKASPDTSRKKQIPSSGLSLLFSVIATLAMTSQLPAATLLTGGQTIDFSGTTASFDPDTAIGFRNDDATTTFNTSSGNPGTATLEVGTPSNASALGAFDYGFTFDPSATDITGLNFFQLDFSGVSGTATLGLSQLYLSPDNSLGEEDLAFNDNTPSSNGAFSLVFDITSDDLTTLDLMRLDLFNSAVYDGSRIVLTGVTFGAELIDIPPVPEPSSTALLGLGGLALMLRRRR